MIQACSQETKRTQRSMRFLSISSRCWRSLGGKQVQTRVRCCDLAAACKDASFASLPADLWPSLAPTEELAAERSKLKRMGVAKPFVYGNVRKFCPPWGMAQARLHRTPALWPLVHLLLECCCVSCQPTRWLGVPARRAQPPLPLNQRVAAFSGAPSPPRCEA